MLRNAIRHDPKGSSVEVELSTKDGRRSSRSATTGPGVPADALSEIFKPFYRVESDRGRSSGGVGLGLAIASRAVELHQGQITAQERQPRVAGRDRIAGWRVSTGAGVFPCLGLFVVALSRGIPGGWKRLAIVGSPVGASKYCVGARVGTADQGLKAPGYLPSPLSGRRTTAQHQDLGSRARAGSHARDSPLDPGRLLRNDAYVGVRPALLPFLDRRTVAIRISRLLEDDMLRLFRTDRPATR